MKAFRTSRCREPDAKGLPVAPTLPPPYARRLYLTAVLLTAIFVRLHGLDNDLARGRVYHPDTPKQVREVREFLAGRYLHTDRGRDYDGYPFFASYTAAIAWQGYAAARTVFSRTMGRPQAPILPEPEGLHALMRGINVVFSSLAVALVYAIGSSFWAWAVGAAAALWLALSPIDVVAVKDATGDVMAAFMALAALYYALRVARDNRRRDYVFGGFFAAAAFGAKYQGGMVLLPLLIAHLCRYPPLRSMLSGKSIRRGLIMMASFIGGAMITNPAFLIDAKLTYRNLRRFVEHTSGFGLSAEMQALSPLGKLTSGLRDQLPALINLLGPIIALAVLAALLLGLWGSSGRRRASAAPGGSLATTAPARAYLWIAASLPLLYLVLGIALKPNAHIVYHSFATPALFLIAAVALVSLTTWCRWRAAGILLGTLLTLAAAFHLAVHTRRENFFFRHNDTRLVAESWARDNLPSVVSLRTGMYTFAARHWPEPDAQSPRRAYVYSARQMPPPADGAFVMQTLRFENFKSTPFRNWPIRFDIRAPDLIREGFQAPPPQWLPASKPIDMIPVGGSLFSRGPQRFDLLPGRERRVTLVAESPLTEAVVLLRSAGLPALVRLSVGGRRRRIALPNHTVRAVEIAAPRPVRGLKAPRQYYRVRAAAVFGIDFDDNGSWLDAGDQIVTNLANVSVTIAATSREKAWAWYLAGEYDRAFDVLESVGAEGRGPAEQLLHGISGRLAGRLNATDLKTHPLGMSASLQVDDPAVFFDLLGISPEYLDNLPAIMFGCDDIEIEQSEQQARFRLLTPFRPLLDQGWYRVDIEGINLTPPAGLELRDDWDRLVKVSDLVEIDHGAGYRAWFRAPPWPSNLRLVFSGVDDPPGERLTVMIRPDAMRTMNSYLALYHRLRDPDGGDSQEDDILHYRELLRCGDLLSVRGDSAGARDCYLAAQRAAPDRLLPRARLAGLAPDAVSADTLCAVPMVPTRAVFERGIRLRGYRLDTRDLRPGGTLGLNLYWQAPIPPGESAAAAVWVHFMHADTGALIFQGDRSLFRADLRMPAYPDEFEPFLQPVDIPPNIPAGVYHLRVGLWLPHRRQRLGLLEADLPHDKRSVKLAELRIGP